MVFLPMLSGGKLLAQIGMMNNNPSPSATLDLRVPGANKGILLPQVSLTALTGKSPVVSSTADTSLMVYNTNAAITGGTGYYYWDGGQWIKLVTGTSGNVVDNLGNHTATMALNMTSHNVTSVDKLSTQTTSIAKGVNGGTAVAGAVLTAGDVTGSSNWAIPQTPRTFFWKGNGDPLFYSIAKPAASMSWPEFNNKTFTAPADGMLQVELLMYPSPASNSQSGYDLSRWQDPEYAVGSILLQPMANNVAIPNSAVKMPFTVCIETIGYASGQGGILSGARQAVYLSTIFPVTKGTVYSFAITVAGEAVQPGDIPTSLANFTNQYNGIRFMPAGMAPNTATDITWHVLSGVFYPNSN